ncbi:MAG TPA: VOC family protein [Actinopolymorphaceae bacterium]
MASKFSELAIDCADPDALSRFWCAVLDYEVLERDGEEGTVTIGPASAPEDLQRRGPVPPVWTFARVPEGKVVKNRVHMDVHATDREQDEEVRRLLDLGAQHADIGQTGDETWVTLLDPEGNEFCVLSGRRL